jgi:hypothetical protein
MSLKTKGNLILLLVLQTALGYAQLQPKFPNGMPSANASCFDVFSATPVSKFTGVPDISVPLLTVNSGNLSIPVTLSYHANGVAPDVHPGWVGLGWSLFSGGVITRKTNGRDDDDMHTDVGYYNSAYKLRDTAWSTLAKMQSLTDEQIDYAPDEFNFSVAGISGSFYLNDQGKWQVKCDQDVKVVFDGNDFIQPFLSTPPPSPFSPFVYYPVFGKFTLITADGTKFIFGGDNTAIDYSLDFFNQNITMWSATAWYLKKIIAADGVHTIDLTYERDQYTNVLYYNLYKNNFYFTGPHSCSNEIDFRTTVLNLGGNLISPVYLKSIETPTEQILFDRSTSVELRYPQSRYDNTYQTYGVYTGPTTGSLANMQQVVYAIVERSLYTDTALYKFLPLLHQNGIEAYPGILSNLQWKKLDKIRLFDKSLNKVTHQYQFNYNNNAAQRLTLLSLQESNPSGSPADTTNPYQFFYDSSYALPDYLLGQTDPWGGYRGSRPSAWGDFSVVPGYMVAGTLRKIIYPTGGHKLFFFEPNTYSSYVSANRASLVGVAGQTTGGRLRIKSILDYDPVSKALTSKKYYYVKNFTLLNKGNSPSSGILSFTPVYQTRVSGHALPSGDVFYMNMSYSNTVLPADNGVTGSICYSEVAEVNDDNSYTVYKFTNFDDGHMDENYINSLLPENTFLYPVSSLSLERGKPKYIAAFDSTGKKLKSTSITYAPLHNLRSFVKSVYTKKYQLCNWNNIASQLTGPYVSEGVSYKIYTYPYLPVTIADSTFPDLNNQPPVVSVTTQYYDNPDNKLNTRTEHIRTDGKKTTNLSLYPQDYATGTAFIDSMMAHGITGLPVEKIAYVTNPASGSINIQAGAINTYQSLNPFQRDTDYQLETDVPLALSSFKFSGSATGLLPYTAATQPFSKDPRYKAQSSYNYDAYGNLQQSNLVNGFSSSVIWGYNHQLPIAEVKNATADKIYYTGFEEDATGTSTDSKVGFKSKLLNGAAFSLPVMPALPSGKKYILSYWYKNTGGSWTLSENRYTSLPASVSGYTLLDELRIYPEGAQMNTASYVSSRGLPASGNDVSGRSRLFEYDGLERLKVVRDENKNILKQYSYAYAPSVSTAAAFYFNNVKSGNFQCACTGGKTGTTVSYLVPAGSYLSTISQADADNKAQADVTANGQTFANTYGQCLFYSVIKSGTFLRTTCGTQTPAPYVYTVPANTYSSALLQSIADSLAQADVNAYGQSYANAYGTCYTPSATITAVNGLSYTSGTHKTLSVSLTKSTGGTYQITGVQEGGSGNVTVPPGTYSIGFSIAPAATYIVRLMNGSSVIDCKPNTGSPFTNVVIANGNTITVTTLLGTCPPPP